MFESVKFGDVFRLEETEYVFLAATQDLIYAARILSPKETSMVEAFAAHPQNKNSILLCYVILDTKEFQGRAAHLIRPEYDTNIHIDLLGIGLNGADIAKLKGEISRANVPRALKEAVEQL